MTEPKEKRLYHERTEKEIEFLKEIGKRIEELVEANHITFQMLANRTDIDRASLYRYRKGELEMGILTLIRIANELNTTPEFLLSGKRP